MVKRIRIGIVGCGAVGTSLAKSIHNDFSKEARLRCLYDIDKDKADSLARIFKYRPVVSRSLASLIDRTDLVIESATAGSCLFIAKSALKRGRDVIVISVGGIVGHINQLRRLAINKNARVYVPSGAICGIDGLKAAKQERIKSVLLITRKNPRSFSNIDYIKRKGIRLDKIKKDIVLFSGSASRAIRLFPQNINVAATLSIAGIGQEKTQVRIIASNKVNRNIHELYVDSNAGRIFTRVENLLHPHNPKTSFLAVLSTIAILRQILQPIRVGS